jgi:hypothetical protein
VVVLSPSTHTRPVKNRDYKLLSYIMSNPKLPPCGRREMKNGKEGKVKKRK